MRGSIPSRDSPKSLKQLVTAPLPSAHETDGADVTCPGRCPLLTGDQVIVDVAC